MPDTNLCLRPNDTDVAAKVMDGEAILINVTSGMYHSMDGVGAAAWELIAGGHSIAQIVETLCRRYEVDASRAAAEIDALVQALLDEQLVVVSEDPAPTDPADDGVVCGPWETPTLETYRDMSDLLALDPPMPGLQQAPWDEEAA